MTRIVEERWLGVGWDVVHEQVHAAGQDGLPLVDEHGLPVTVPHTTLVFVLNEPPHAQRVVRVPFADEARRELVTKLTGGIVVVAANGSRAA